MAKLCYLYNSRLHSEVSWLAIATDELHQDTLLPSSFLIGFATMILVILLSFCLSAYSEDIPPGEENCSALH